MQMQQHLQQLILIQVRECLLRLPFRVLKWRTMTTIIYLLRTATTALTVFGETKNGGTTWTSVEGNLPDMPIRWALFNPTDSSQALLATEVGVWSTDALTAGTTNWPLQQWLSQCTYRHVTN